MVAAIVDSFYPVTQCCARLYKTITLPLQLRPRQFLELIALAVLIVTPTTSIIQQLDAPYFPQLRHNYVR